MVCASRGRECTSRSLIVSDDRPLIGRIAWASLANASAIFKNKSRRGGGPRRSVFPPARLFGIPAR